MTSEAFEIAKTPSISEITGHKVDAQAASLSARSKAEVEARFVIAKKFMRDENAVFARILRACENPAFAEGAEYAYPRAGQQVKGPSVQLARELARMWGNLDYGFEIVRSDVDDEHIRGFALDYETNARPVQDDHFEKAIQRRNRATGKTEWIEADERELRELRNKRGAIVERNCILRVIPAYVVEAAKNKCRETMEKAAKNELSQSRDESIRRLVLAFDKLGVSTEMLERQLGHELSLISESELTDLRAIYKSIADGNSKREEHFEFGKREESAGAEELNAKLMKKRGA